jgi:hypothetical protein
MCERLCFAQGEIENRPEDQLPLFAHWMITESLCGNQTRSYLSTFEYTLMRGLLEQALVVQIWPQPSRSGSRGGTQDQGVVAPLC